MEQKRIHVLFRGTHAQRIRLGTGLVLFAFAATHFLNHAFGLWSVDAMLSVQDWRTAITRSWLGSFVLAMALIGHLTLTLGKLATRKTLKMPVWEAVQIATGLTIPLLLFPHIVNTRVAWTFFGVSDTYAYELARLWPGSAWTQSTLLLLVWVHGCIGLHHWLKLASWYQRLQPVMLGLAVMVPVAALGGFMAAGRVAQLANADPATFAQLKAATKWPDAAASADLAWWREAVRIAFLLVLFTIAGIFGYRVYRMRGGGDVTISYVSGPTVQAFAGSTLLEISRMGDVPHAAVCGGRARCSTCRVRVLDGEHLLEPAGATERETLASINAPPGIRLACQIRPVAPLTVARLIHPYAITPDVADMISEEALGVERTMVVMFFDIRGFTRLSEGRLPYDVVFILNQVFAGIGQVVRAQGGWIDKYMGDGLMAVFGREVGPAEGARQALRAAQEIDLTLDYINTGLLNELGEFLRIGMGMHAGPLVLGRLGFGDDTAVTVIGDTVNTASRLEALTKDVPCQLILSKSVADYAGWEPDGVRRELVQLEGSGRRIDVFILDNARNLPVHVLRQQAQPLEPRSKPISGRPRAQS